MTIALLVAIKICIAAMILAIGMGARFADLLYLWQRPALLVRSLLAMYVAVPLAAYVLVAVLPVSPAIKAAMLVVAVSAGAPLLPRKLGTIGDGAYVFSLVVTSSLLAIAVVPAWIALLAWHFGLETEVTPAEVALITGKAFLLPLAIGFAAHAMAPAWCERIAERLLLVAGRLLILAGLVLLATHWTIVLEVPWAGMAALMVLMVIALAIGHLLGGPLPDNRTALAIACATRHIGIAVVVATTFRGPRTLVLLATYIVATALVSIPYLQWRRRLARKEVPVAAGG